jgi:hypothetical protein
MEVPSIKLPFKDNCMNMALNSSGLKKAVRIGITLLRWPTGPIRMLPNFIIIGAQRSGTTSLFRYLSQHPSIVPSLFKETHYFDNAYHHTKLGINWYKAQFPTLVYRNHLLKTKNIDMITGESTPYYLFHPMAADRIAKSLPQVKLIALLRNPINRAFSHYNHSRRKQREGRSFVDAIDNEVGRLDGEVDKLIKSDKYYSYQHQHLSYLSRGLYYYQLLRWQRFIDREQVLILKSEDLFNNPQATLDVVLHFLNIPGFLFKNLKKHNKGNYMQIDANIKEKLADLYRPHNDRLSAFLGRNFNWN